MPESCSLEDMLSPEARESSTRGFTNHDHRSVADDVRRFEELDTFFRLNPESPVCKREVERKRLSVGACLPSIKPNGFSWKRASACRQQRANRPVRLAQVSTGPRDHNEVKRLYGLPG